MKLWDDEEIFFESLNGIHDGNIDMNAFFQ